jgi:dihydrolipoamide dehydrogenase
VSGDGQTFEAPLVVINTGTSALVPMVPGLDGTPYLTNATFFDQQSLPKSMLVMGGGYIGLELGQGMARCGSAVHIIDSNGRVMSREEADASDALALSLADDGVQLHLQRKAAHVKHDRGFLMRLDDGTELRAQSLLVATGRRPNSSDLMAAASGIELDARGFVIIDDRFATTCAGVYAIGDVAGQPAFTHVSWEDYRRLKGILAGELRTRNDRTLAYATYTEPQIARVGMTLAQAKSKGLNCRAVTMPITEIARAIEWGQEYGFFRLVVDSDSDKILGATMVGYETAELVHVVLAHIEAGSTWRVLERSVHIHPTYAEGLPTLARMLLS